ncbi:hypothetical protein OYC64_017719 [Pagothenia borchgrevinki]|uniref:Uncharacterized protein n=1 Tax=Pagothenia borchgrevinki TaxID=8213 RepID=A0ABD2GLR8_PAGBO
MQTLGLMAAAHLVVPLGLLTRLQRWFSGLRLDSKRHKQRLVTIPPPSVEGNLRYWGFPKQLRRGTPLGRVTSYVTVFKMHP